MRFLRLALRMSGLRRSCGVIESMIAIWRLSTLSSSPALAIWFFILATPGIMPIRPHMPPIAAICIELFAHVGEIELALAHLLGGAHRLFGVDIGGGFLDQRDDVAHAENAAGDARRVEFLQRVEFFAGADQLDRLVGDRAHRQRRAAAAVAVDAGEHDAGQADALVEGARQIDRVLAGQRVGDQQHFVRIGGALDLGRLVHHLVVERGAAGGVEQHHVVAAELGGLERALAICGGIWPATTGSVSICASRPSTASCSIAAGRRTSSEAISTFFFCRSVRRRAILRGGGGFAGALQADHHDGDRRRGIEIDALAVGAERRDQLVVHDLDDHLAGRDRLHHLDADRLLLDVVGEGARHVERDVGLQQRAAHFAQRRIDVGFAERAAAGQAVENAAKFFRQ